MFSLKCVWILFIVIDPHVLLPLLIFLLHSMPDLPWPALHLLAWPLLTASARLLCNGTNGKRRYQRVEGERIWIFFSCFFSTYWYWFFLVTFQWFHLTLALKLMYTLSSLISFSHEVLITFCHCWSLNIPALLFDPWNLIKTMVIEPSLRSLQFYHLFLKLFFL